MKNYRLQSPRTRHAKVLSARRGLSSVAGVVQFFIPVVLRHCYGRRIGASQAPARRSRVPRLGVGGGHAPWWPAIWLRSIDGTPAVRGG